MYIYSYEECFDVYRDIIKNTNDDYEEERETNLSAVIANMLLDGSVSDYTMYLIYSFIFLGLAEHQLYNFCFVSKIIFHHLNFVLP